MFVRESLIELVSFGKASDPLLASSGAPSGAVTM